MRVVRSVFSAVALAVPVGLGSCTFPDYTTEPDYARFCGDGLLNGVEADTDCGGPDCEGCSEGRLCAADRDCSSRRCLTATCRAPSCTDGVANGTETGRDCGGNCSTQKCPTGVGCIGGTDCESQICAAGSCQAPTCDDQTKNGGETDRDCGGGTCAGCPNGRSCSVAQDCLDKLCDRETCVPRHCIDDAFNETETDLDCGGPCADCVAGQSCLQAEDCDSSVCSGSKCQPPSCDDNVENGDESDQDCGGKGCEPCLDGGACRAGTDCTSAVCQGGVCQVPSCSDSVANGAEADADCGSACPAKACLDGKRCLGRDDCLSSVCNQTCQAPSCSDLAKNQGEGDVDCGGPCSKLCAVGASCTTNTECVSGACEVGTCAATLQVFYQTDVPAQSEWIRPYLEIRNTGPTSVPLEELEVRYFYTYEGMGPQLVECFYSSPVTCANVSMSFVNIQPELPGANTYYRIGFSPGAGSLAAKLGNVRLETAFHKEPFVPFDQSNDYSYDGSKSAYSPHDEVCLYRNGVLVWGEEP